MAINYLNMPNGVHLEENTNKNVLGVMEQLNKNMHKIGIDINESSKQNKKELDESRKIIKEFEKYIKKNDDGKNDYSKMSKDFAKEFTKEWEHSYGSNINESTLKSLNEISREMLELKKNAKESYGKGFQSTSQYREELEILRLQSSVKLKNAILDDKEKSKENKSLTNKNETNIESTIKDINENIKKLNDESFEKFGENFEQNEDYQNKYNQLIKDSYVDIFKSYQKDRDEMYEKSHITDNTYAEDLVEKTKREVLKNIENLNIEAYEKFGENFKENEEYQNQLIKLQKQSYMDVLESQQKMRDEMYDDTHLTDNIYREDNNLEKFERSIIKDIENLNAESFLKYGENFKENEDYQKNYQALIKKAEEDRKRAKKDDWDARDDLFHDSVEKIKDVISDQKKSLMGFLGPLNMVISPMQEFFGGSLTKYLFGKIKKGVSTKVTEKQVAKLEDGEGYLYLGNKLDQLLNNNTQNLLNSNTQNLLNNTQNQNLLNNTQNQNLLPILEQISYNTDPTIDTASKIMEKEKSFIKNDFLGGNTMKFWNKKSKKRPTSSDLSNLGGIGAIGLYIGDILQNQDDKNKPKIKDKMSGLLSGGKLLSKGNIVDNLATGGIIASVVWMIIDGISAMFKEEWGGNKISRFAAGALAGTDKGVKGALKNGGKWALLGASIGTKIAPGLGTLIGGVIGLVIGGVLGAIGGERLNKLFVKMGNWVKEKILPPIMNILSYLKEKFIDPIVNTFKNIVDIWKGEGSIKDKILGTLKELWEFVKTWITNCIQFWKDVFIGIGNMFVKLWDVIKNFTTEYILPPITNFFKKIGNMFVDVWKHVKDFTTTYIVTPISNFFIKIKEGIDNAFNFVKDSINNHIIDPIKSFFGNIGEIFNILSQFDPKHPIESVKIIGDLFSEKKELKKEEKENKKVKDAIFSNNNSEQYIIRNGERIQLDPQDNILVTTNPLGETKSYGRGELNPIIENVSNTNSLLSKTSKTEFSKVEKEIKKQNTLNNNKINTVTNNINNQNSEKVNYRPQLEDIVKLLSQILTESKDKIQMPSLTRNDLLQVAGGYF